MLKVLQRLEVAVIKNKRILKCLLMMVVSLLLILNFSIEVSASTNYDRQEVDACITISQRLSVKGWSKADVLAQNRAKGRAFEQQEFAKFKSQNKNAVDQITVKTSSGVRTRGDANVILVLNFLWGIYEDLRSHMLFPSK